MLIRFRVISLKYAFVACYLVRQSTIITWVKKRWMTAQQLVNACTPDASTYHKWVEAITITEIWNNLALTVILWQNTLCI